jgi:diguanylate cyclase (GGDEF)-like protein
LRRQTTSHARLLQLLLDVPGLSELERSRIQSALYDPAAQDLEGLAHELIDALVERGILRARPGRQGIRRIEDPWNRRVFTLHGYREAPVRVVDPKTLPPPESSQFKSAPESILENLTFPDSNHVEALLDPRGILRRLEGELGRILGVARSLFHPLQFPPEWMVLLGEERPDLVWSSLFEEPPPSPGGVVMVPDISRVATRESSEKEGSLLLMGLGSTDPAWQGVVEWFSTNPDDFPLPRQSLAVLLGRVLQTRLTSSLRLQAIVFRDVLTGVYNRSYFRDQVEKEIRLARRKEETLGLCIVDIDDFKEINRRFGYSGGDKVLREVAQRLRGSLRSSDTLARYGGDEFAALLGSPLNPAEAPMIAERLREAARGLILPLETLKGASMEVSVTVSIGGAIYPRDGETLTDLWTMANRRLVEAKDEGKDRWSFPAETPKEPRKGKGGKKGGDT